MDMDTIQLAGYWWAWDTENTTVSWMQCFIIMPDIFQALMNEMKTKETLRHYVIPIISSMLSFPWMCSVVWSGLFSPYCDICLLSTWTHRLKKAIVYSHKFHGTKFSKSKECRNGPFVWPCLAPQVKMSPCRLHPISAVAGPVSLRFYYYLKYTWSCLAGEPHLTTPYNALTRALLGLVRPLPSAGGGGGGGRSGPPSISETNRRGENSNGNGKAWTRSFR